MGRWAKPIAVVTWTGVVGFALAFGVAYSFIHRRWWALGESESPGDAMAPG